MNILFVCHGNTCRSPMAEYLFRDMLKRGGSWKISSAGLYALDGQQAAPEAVATLRELEVDLTPHRSRRLSGEMLEEADVVLTMTRDQSDEIRQKWPEASSLKVFTLKKYVGWEGSGSPDILDPYGSAQVTYVSCAGEIRELTAKLVSVLEREEKK